MLNLDLFKEMYYKELELKEKINARINVPISILTVLIGGILYYLKNPISVNGFLGVLYYIFLGVFTINIFIVIFLVYKAYFGYEYRYIPSTIELDNKTKEITLYFDNYYEQYYKDYYNHTKEELIKQEVDSVLYDVYKDATAVNAKSNITKLAFIRFIGWALLSSVITGALTTVLYYLAKHLIISVV